MAKKIKKMNRSEVVREIRKYYQSEAIYMMKHREPIQLEDQKISTAQLKRVLRNIKHFCRYGRVFLILDVLEPKDFKGGDFGWEYSDVTYFSANTEELEFNIF